MGVYSRRPSSLGRGVSYDSKERLEIHRYAGPQPMETPNLQSTLEEGFGSALVFAGSGLSAVVMVQLNIGSACANPMMAEAALASASTRTLIGSLF